MTTRHRWLVFLTVALVAGFEYWWNADWWFYVDFHEGPMPKGVLPWWVQLPVSTVVGCVWGGIGVAVISLAMWAWSRINKRH